MWAASMVPRRRTLGREEAMFGGGGSGGRG